MRLPAEVPDPLLHVPYGKGCILSMMPQEITAGIRRGKWWKRIQAEAKREGDAVTPQTPRAPGRGAGSWTPTAWQVAERGAQAVSGIRRPRVAVLPGTGAELGKQHGVRLRRSAACESGAKDHDQADQSDTNC